MACPFLGSGDAPSFENIKPSYTTRSLLNSHLPVLKTTFFPWLFLRRASKFLTYSFMSRLCTIMSSLIVEHPTQVPRQMLSDGPLGDFSRWSRSVIKPLLWYKPMCVEKVVVFRELSFNLPWWCPFDMSKWKKTVETPRSFKTTSMVGCWISLRGMVWFANSHIRVQSHLPLILKFFGGVDNGWWYLAYRLVHFFNDILFQWVFYSISIPFPFPFSRVRWMAVVGVVGPRTWSLCPSSNPPRGPLDWDSISHTSPESQPFPKYISWFVNRTVPWGGFARL